ncbi:MAG: nucleoside deaminase [Salinisphaera sp.]|nr:nucleoside deaminase [Salinisphaera sp.]
MTTPLSDRWTLDLPAWVTEVVADQPPPYADDEAAMRLALTLARRNIVEGAGGPFGALVIDRDSGDLIAAGVNCVFASGVSCAHAEIVALTLAHQATGHADLGEPPALALIASAEPCAMCLGATAWSGIRNLVIGARDTDIRAIGFDEGSKPPGWVEALAARGISTRRDLLRDEASVVLRAYAERAGILY